MKALWHESLEHQMAHLVEDGSSRAVCGALGFTWTLNRTHERNCSVCKNGKRRKWPDQEKEKGGEK